MLNNDRQAGLGTDGRDAKVKLITAYFVVIMLAHTLMYIGSQLIETSRTLYVQSLGGTASFAGLLLTLTAASATVLRIFSGRTSDKRGRRGLIISGSVIFGLSALSFNLFPYLGAMPIISLVRGVGMSMAVTTLSIAITDVIPKERMGEGLGYFGLTQPLTYVVAPAISAGLIAAGSFRAIYYITTGFILSVAVIMFFCNYEKDTKFLEQRKALPEERADPPAEETGDAAAGQRGIAAYFEKTALPCAAIQLFISIAQGANNSFLMAYAFHIGVPNPAINYTLSAVFMVATRVVVGRLADRTKPVFMVAIGISFSAAAYACLLFSQDNAMFFYIAGAAAGISNGIVLPVMQATVVRISPDSRRGAAMSTYTFPMDLGIAIGSLMWGIIVDHSGYSSMYVCCVVSTGIAIALTIFLLRKVESARPKMKRS